MANRALESCVHGRTVVFFARRWGRLVAVDGESSASEPVWTHDGLASFVKDIGPALSIPARQARRVRDELQVLDGRSYRWTDLRGVLECLGIGWTRFESDLVFAYMRKAFGLEPCFPDPPTRDPPIPEPDAAVVAIALAPAPAPLEMTLEICSRDELIAALLEARSEISREQAENARLRQHDFS